MEKELWAMVDNSRSFVAREEAQTMQNGAIAGRSALSLGASRVVLRLCL